MIQALKTHRTGFSVPLQPAPAESRLTPERRLPAAPEFFHVKSETVLS